MALSDLGPEAVVATRGGVPKGNPSRLVLPLDAEGSGEWMLCQ
ncbi:hypothetical protein X971_4772 [Agrobacterium tumefaciens LBA4213 (Ach5)]|nr:hypothetical protein X971_4772 [Agrobacterium tumefaciens LBA4213 (Ach5)]